MSERVDKKKLIEEMREIYKKHEFKKSVVKKILDDLDSKDEISEEHISAMTTIDELFKEMKELEIESDSLGNKIKNK